MRIRELWNRTYRQRLRRPRMAWSEYRGYRALHPFDQRFGVETGGLLYDLSSGHPHDAHNYGYCAVAPSVFHRAMERLGRNLHEDYERFTFVDLGSGKGRALLLASEYPFHEAAGVEISAALHRAAQANIARYLSLPDHVAAPRSRKISSRLMDAAGFPWPESPLVVYLWNAFAAPVMERVLASLEASLVRAPREVYWLYFHPEQEAMLDASPFFRKLWREEIAMSEEDRAAWPFPSASEVCAAWGPPVREESAEAVY